MTWSVADRVARGSQWLDLVWPGWREEIDLDLLDMGVSRHCVTGQLWGGYLYTPLFEAQKVKGYALQLLGWEYGFDVALDEGAYKTQRLRLAYKALTEAWKEEIQCGRGKRMSG